MQIYESDSVEADSAFSADIVSAHASEDYDESILVEDGSMVTPSRVDIELSDPSLSIKGVHLC